MGSYEEAEKMDRRALEGHKKAGSGVPTHWPVSIIWPKFSVSRESMKRQRICIDEHWKGGRRLPSCHKDICPATRPSPSRPAQTRLRRHHPMRSRMRVVSETEFKSEI